MVCCTDDINAAVTAEDEAAQINTQLDRKAARPGARA